MSIIHEPRKPVRLPLSRAIKVSNVKYSERMTFRVTRELREKIEKRAISCGMKVSEFTRLCMSQIVNDENHPLF